VSEPSEGLMHRFYFLNLREDMLNVGGFFVDAEDVFHDGDDLAEGGVGAHCGEDVGHGVFGVLAGYAQLVEGMAGSRLGFMRVRLQPSEIVEPSGEYPINHRN